MLVVLIRGLSVRGYAYTTLFLTLAQFAGSAAGSGVRTRYLREEAERLSRQRRDKDQDTFLAALLKGTALIVAIGLVATPVVRIVKFGSSLNGRVALVLTATAFAVGYSAIEMAIARFQARRRFYAVGSLGVIRALALLGAALLIVLTSDGQTSIGLWFGGSMILVGSAVTALIFKRGETHRRHARPSALSREETWLSVYYVAAAGFAYVDVFVAGALLSARDVAALGAALRYLAVVLGPIPALGAILRVRTAQADLVDSATSQSAMLLAWMRRTILPAAALVAVTAGLAPVVIPLIDKGRYPGSIIVFQIFLATALTAYATAPGVSILMTQRRYADLAGIYAVGLALNLVGDIVVARRYGITGIAVVSSSIYVALDVLMASTGFHRARRAALAAGKAGQ